MNSTVAQMLAEGLEHHRHGRLADAEAAYRRVLEREPDHPDALHRLGVVAQRAGRNDVALELIDRAIALNPADPAYYSDVAIVLHSLGRVDEAIGRYRDALIRDGTNPRLHNALGIALKDRGRLADAAESFRAAVSLAPDHVGARNNLANVLRELGDSAQAAALYREVLQARPDSPDFWLNLGHALADQQAFDEAATAYRKAFTLRPDRASCVRLAGMLQILGRADEAATLYARALRVTESADVIAGFVRALVSAELHVVDDGVAHAAMRALAVPWARPANLSAACARIIACVPGVRACVERAWRAWPARLSVAELFGDDRSVVFGEPLLRLMLESAPVCDLALERFLTLARFALLDAIDDGVVDDQALPFACALARQCFINDYVFSTSGEETKRAANLRDRLCTMLAQGETPRALAIAVTAAYAPLASLPHTDKLLASRSPDSLVALLQQQLRDPADEQASRAKIRRLTTIGDGVSSAVRTQYEEHPYPRWVKLPPSDLAASAEARSGRFPAELLGSTKRRLDILVAGCGTGQESIEFAQAFPRARVLAIDLSLASLAYATRKAREVGVTNVEHAQADLLELPSIGRRFDVISSVGVLHHLADPARGMAKLASVLAPEGHMLIGLYSERGRRDVAAARAFIAEHGYRPTNDDIRRCRQALLAADDGRTFSRLAMRADFYVTAECRDLLFHVEEHRFTLPQIRRLLDALRLRFASFLFSSDLAKRYLERFPNDRAMNDLDRFDAFEAEFPDAFAGMYIFWVRKGA